MRMRPSTGRGNLPGTPPPRAIPLTILYPVLSKSPPDEISQPAPSAVPDAMSKEPTVSVVVPNYNHGQYLPRCLTALVEQSVLPREIIVIDDASTDNSAQIVEDFSRRHPLIRLHRNTVNQGVVYGANLGLQLAHGDWVLFAAADDFVLPGFMEKSVALLRQHPESALCCTIGDWHEVATGMNWHVSVGMGNIPCFIPPGRMAELERAGKFYIASHSAIMRRQPLLDAGAFLPPLRWHCDWFAITVASFRHGICFVPEPLARFFINPTSYYKSGSRREEHRQVMCAILDLLLTEKYRDVESLIRESGAMFLFGKPMLSVMLRHPAYRRFLTPAFLRKNLGHIIKLELKRFTPGFVANLYFRLAGYRAKTQPAA